DVINERSCQWQPATSAFGEASNLVRATMLLDSSERLHSSERRHWVADSRDSGGKPEFDSQPGQLADEARGEGSRIAAHRDIQSEPCFSEIFELFQSPFLQPLSSNPELLISPSTAFFIA